MRVGWRFRNEFDLCIFVNKRSALMSPKTGPTPPARRCESKYSVATIPGETTIPRSFVTVTRDGLEPPPTQLARRFKHRVPQDLDDVPGSAVREMTNLLPARNTGYRDLGFVRDLFDGREQTLAADFL